MFSLFKTNKFLGDQVLKDIGGLECWYDFSDTSTITEGAGGITNVLDKSGNGNDMGQLTEAKRPAYVSWQNRKAASIPSNDNNKFLENAGLSSSLRTVAFMCDFLLADPFLFEAVFGNNFNKGVFTEGATTVFTGSNGWNTSVAEHRVDSVVTDAFPDNQPFTCVVEASGPAVYSGNFKLMNNNGGGSWGGRLGEFIGWDRVLTLSEKQNVERYLRGKWNI